MNRVLAPAAIAALLVLSLVAAMPVGAQQDIDAIDANNPLTDKDAIREYERAGVVSENLTVIDMGVTVAEKHGDAGIAGYHTDFNNQFLCMEYREDIPRDIRLYVPDDYFRPRVKAELESLTSTSTATLEPTADEKFTAVRVRFDGPERACFALSREAGIYFDGKSWAYGLANNSTSWDIPRLAGGEQQWQFVAPEQFENDTSPSIDTAGKSLTLQYDDSAGSEEAAWIPVPTCDKPSQQKVCRYQKNGEPDKVYLMSSQENPPPVRYKTGTDPISSVRSWGNDFKRVWTGIADRVTGLFGGGSGGEE